MLRALTPGLLLSSFLISVTSADNGFPRCNCDDEGFWTIERILDSQRVSDFLIAVAYFSIPIELLYFVSCSNVPFKWVLFQFIAFIVLCGMTHLLNGWAYSPQPPHPFQLMLALTIFKFLTALVSCATAITLITLIPLLLKVKVREFMLRKKAWDLGIEVGLIRKKKEASWHVRMLTQEIRKSLDRHTILYTTLEKLSETLDLQNCAVWMPNESKTEVNLTHQLKGRNFLNYYNHTVPISDPDVVRIKESDGVMILGSASALGAASGGGLGEPGAVAAIRMPMLRVANFKGGTPEMRQTCYAILVLVLPSGESRGWSSQELEIVEVVADQVAVALSHAAVLEESQLMRDQLVQQNQALHIEKKNAMMASQAWTSFQKVMSDGMRRPMHSILGLLSLMQDENMSHEQRTIVDAMMKSSNVLSTLISDAMDTPTMDNGRFQLEMRPFRLHSMIKEAACLTKCFCIYRGVGFEIEVERSLPDYVVSDEKRVIQVILHMIGNLLSCSYEGGYVTFRVSSQSGSQGRHEQRWATWKSGSSDGSIHVRFEVGIHGCSQSGDSHTTVGTWRPTTARVEEDLSFSICKKLVQLMQGNIWVVPNSQGFAQSMGLVLRFQLRPSIGITIYDGGESSDRLHSNSLFRGLQILLADSDNINRAVTRKMLEKLGCAVSVVTSDFECLSALGPNFTSFQIVLLDLHTPELDGIEVARRIRKFRKRGWPLIVALTASADEDIWERCLQTGMNGVLCKPVQLQGIADELRRVLLQPN
ncbi:Histidine kinase/HSP90-like ATPase [Dillenia turbinata]|uniref:Ethylene receptor n=1 Tax=Dillenia turbinata TaxID=194707 RepID=A0AAN8YVL5_9MAGN